VRIGAAICRALAARGARVVIHYRHARMEAEALRREIAAAGGTAWTVTGELTAPGAPEAVLRAAIQAAGPLDVLVNNAAVFHKDRLSDLTVGRMEAEFAANLFAPARLMSVFAAQNRPGRIVNLLDRRIAGHDTTCAPYVLTKQALAEATRLAALEWAPRLTVNAVAPGAILPPPGAGADYLLDHAGPAPLRHACTPEDVAAAAMFLLEQPGITGQIIFVDGGQHLLA